MKGTTVYNGVSKRPLHKTLGFDVSIITKNLELRFRFFLDVKF